MYVKMCLCVLFSVCIWNANLILAECSNDNKEVYRVPLMLSGPFGIRQSGDEYVNKRTANKYKDLMLNKDPVELRDSLKKLERIVYIPRATIKRFPQSESDPLDYAPLDFFHGFNG